MALKPSLITSEEVCVFLEIDQDHPLQQILEAAQQRAIDGEITVAFQLSRRGCVVKLDAKTDLEYIRRRVYNEYRTAALVQ